MLNIKYVVTLTGDNAEEYNAVVSKAASFPNLVVLNDEPSLFKYVVELNIQTTIDT